MEDNNTYLAFTPDTPREAAIAAFQRRFGRPPEKVFIIYPHRLLVAGPINPPHPAQGAAKESARSPEFVDVSVTASPPARPG